MSSSSAPSTTHCAACNDPLLVRVSPDSDSDHELEHGAAGSSSAALEPDVVPDDVELLCGHHYHWDCFSDHYAAAEDDVKHQCPTCHAVVIDDESSKLLVTLRNEGGEQQNLDIAALLEEEAFYDANPELKIVRAFLEFSAEGDIQAVTDLLAEAPELVNCQDFENGQTGLHVALQNRREEMLKFLIERGANKEAQDFEGRDFYTLAREMGATPEEMQRLGAL